MPITPPQYAYGLPGPMPNTLSPIVAVSHSAKQKHKPKLVHPQGFPILGVHPFLGYSSSPAITYDLRESPSTLSSTHRGLPRSTLFQPATSPPTSHLTIISPHLPWRITIKHTSSAVTVHDVLSELYRVLRKPITSQEYHSLLPSDRERRRVADAYKDRYRHARGDTQYDEEKRNGVRRVDFLMGKTRFHGLGVAGKSISGATAGDVWVLHTS